MIRHWRAARGEGGSWLYSPAVPAFFLPGGYCCRPRQNDVVITTGNGAVTPYLRTTQTWNGLAWTTRTDIPLPGRFSSAGAYLNGQLHVTGGVGPAPLDTHHQWTPATDSWSTQLPVPLPRRYEHAAVEMNGSLHLWGGRASASSIIGTAHEYRLGTWITGPSIPGPPRAGARALSLGGFGYLFGGEIGPGTYTTRTDRFDPTTQVWTTRQPMPAPGRQGCGGFTYDNSCTLLGGGRPITTRADMYSPTSDSWMAVMAVPDPARQNSTSPAAVSSHLSAIIGGEDASFNRLSHHHGFSGQSWMALSKLPLEPRKLACGG